MSQLIENMINDMRLRGLSSRTQKSYLYGVRKLTEHFGKEPDQVTEDELKEYLLYLLNEKNYAPATVKLRINGVANLFKYTLKRKSEVLAGFKVQVKNKIPVILSVEEVKHLIGCLNMFHNYVFFVLVYSCGLRISEALHLEVQDIDGKAMRIKIRAGKGNKDRFIPLPQSTYQLLRSYWALHRNPKLIFPASGRCHTKAPVSTTPMEASSVRTALKKAKQKAGLAKEGICVHTFRHSYATHLLEAGVDIRKVQRYLGHQNLQSTSVYLHMTSIGNDEAHKRINSIMRNFERGTQEVDHG